MAKEGSTVSGLMDAFATTVSVSLQYGVPLKDLINKFAHVRFEPSGFTGNQEIPIAKSIVDYIFRWLGSRFLDEDAKGSLGLIDRSAVVDEPGGAAAIASNPFAAGIAAMTSAPAPIVDVPTPAPAPVEDTPKATAVAAPEVAPARPRTSSRSSRPTATPTGMRPMATARPTGTVGAAAPRRSP